MWVKIERVTFVRVPKHKLVRPARALRSALLAWLSTLEHALTCVRGVACPAAQQRTARLPILHAPYLAGFTFFLSKIDMLKNSNLKRKTKIIPENPIPLS